jgi:hypothetical protein
MSGGMLVADGFLEPVQFIHQVALIPGNSDMALQSAVSQAIGTAALTGAFTCTVNVSAYSNTLVQQMIQRLLNLEYITPTLSGTTLTVNW